MIRKESEPRYSMALKELSRLEGVAQYVVLREKGLTDQCIAQHFRVSEELLVDWATNHRASAESGIVSQGRQNDLHGLIARLSREFRDRRNAAGTPNYF